MLLTLKNSVAEPSNFVTALSCHSPHKKYKMFSFHNEKLFSMHLFFTLSMVACIQKDRLLAALAPHLTRYPYIDYCYIDFT